MHVDTEFNEVTFYRVLKAAIISAVPPLMLKTDANPEGLPKAVFDDLQAQLAANRSKFYGFGRLMHAFWRDTIPFIF